MAEDTILANRTDLSKEQRRRVLDEEFHALNGRRKKALATAGLVFSGTGTGALVLSRALRGSDRDTGPMLLISLIALVVVGSLISVGIVCYAVAIGRKTRKVSHHLMLLENTR